MVFLTRTVRFAVNHALEASATVGTNGYAGTPRLAGLGAHYEIDVTCRGEPDATTGYLINIKDIDIATRTHAVPQIEDVFRRDETPDPVGMLRSIAFSLDGSLPVDVHSVIWRLTPTFSLEYVMNDLETAVIRQQFDFSASHRLHADTLSEEENRRVFGKCNNPSGHGHNYRIEPSVVVPLNNNRFTLATLEQLTDEHVIERFDHKNLNVDTEEFGEGGVIASVENIARVCHDILGPVYEAAGGRLLTVQVWETDRTSAIYPASSALAGA